MNPILIKLLYLVTLSLTLRLYSMENKEAGWNILPIELKSHILSLVPESQVSSAGVSMTDTIKSLQDAASVNKEFEKLVKNLLYNPEALENLAKKYIEEYPQSSQEEFFYAVRNNKFGIVQSLINANINVNFKDRNGWTPLMHAANLGLTEMAKILVNARAEVNTKNKEGRTPLILANNEEITKLLIKHGANIDEQDKLGQTALIMASKLGRENQVKILLDAKANSEVQNSSGRTALTIAHQGSPLAPKENYEKIIEMLEHYNQ